MISDPNFSTMAIMGYTKASDAGKYSAIGENGLGIESITVDGKL